MFVFDHYTMISTTHSTERCQYRYTGTFHGHRCVIDLEHCISEQYKTHPLERMHTYMSERVRIHGSLMLPETIPSFNHTQRVQKIHTKDKAWIFIASGDIEKGYVPTSCVPPIPTQPDDGAHLHAVANSLDAFVDYMLTPNVHDILAHGIVAWMLSHHTSNAKTPYIDTLSMRVHLMPGKHPDTRTLWITYRHKGTEYRVELGQVCASIDTYTNYTHKSQQRPSDTALIIGTCIPPNVNIEDKISCVLQDSLSTYHARMAAMHAMQAFLDLDPIIHTMP